MEEAGGTTPLLVVGPDGVDGRLQPGTIFVVGGMEGVVGALIVVVDLGSWLGGSGGSSVNAIQANPYPVLILVINSLVNTENILNSRTLMDKIYPGQLRER